MVHLRFNAQSTSYIHSERNNFFNKFGNSYFEIGIWVTFHMFYFYILKCKDKTLYCGYTNNLKHRELLHNSGKGSKYVRSRGGGKIIYSERFRTLRKALKREAEVKSFSRARKLELIKLSNARS